MSFTGPSDNRPDAPAQPNPNSKIRLSLIGALETYSIMNVPMGNAVLYFHALFTYLVSSVLMLLIYRTYAWYTEQLHKTIIRQVKNDEIHYRTIIVRGVNPELRSEEKLRKYFQLLNLGQVESVVFAREFSKLDRRIQLRNGYLHKLEKLHLTLAESYFQSQRGILAGFPWNSQVRKLWEKSRCCAYWRTHSTIARSPPVVAVTTNRLSRFLVSTNPSDESLHSDDGDSLAHSPATSCSDGLDIPSETISPSFNREQFFAEISSAHPSESVPPVCLPAGDIENQYPPGNSDSQTSLVPTEAENRHKPNSHVENKKTPPLNWEFILDPSHRPLFHEFQPTHLSPRGLNVHTIDHCVRKLLRHDQRVRFYREFGQLKEKFKPTSTAFVTFQSPVVAAICAQTYIMKTPGTRIRMAPEPRDITWSAFALSDSSRRGLVQITINVITSFIIFIWIIPISLVVALVNVEQLSVLFPALKQLYQDSDVMKSFLSSVLPTFTATLFNIVLPYILMGLLRIQGFYTKSAMMDQLTRKYYYFLLFNILLTFTIGQTLIVTTLNLVFFIPLDIPGTDQSASFTNIVMLAVRYLQFSS
jgi:hypothetical protein